MNPIRYINNVVRAIKSYNNKELCVSHHPRVIAIEPTNACPMKCIMCPRQYMTRKIGFMDLKLFMDIINQLEYTSYIGLELFGDALLHPKIDKMVNYMHDKGIVSQISANPVSLTDAAIDKIVNSKLDILLLSLDGIDDVSYKKYRGPNADYNLAVKQIYKLLSKKKGNYPYITIRMINMPGLGKHYSKYKSMWSLKGVDQVSLGSFHTYGNTVKGGNARINNNICYSPWKGVSITWDGKVVPCCYDYDNECVLGDLNIQTLDQIWNGTKMQKLREECISGTFSNSLCSRCTEKLRCESSIQTMVNYIYQNNQHNFIVKKLKNLVKS
jgi:radical SAM protein with 4Fe4S-binding SPASM domain